MTPPRFGERRLILVLGKGGVGKSTCALGLALALAQRGRRVLLCEVGARPVSSRWFGCEATHEPSHVPHVAEHLWVAHLSGEAALAEYLTEQLKVKGLVRLATENRVLARLWRAAPSVHEMALLNCIHAHVSALDGRGRPRFDHVVVDLPATGHALAMLGVPRGIAELIRVGTLYQRARAVDGMLRDAAQTGLCLVTLLEELPAEETCELAEQLRVRVGLRPTWVLANATLDALLSGEERALLQRAAVELQDAGADVRRLLQLGIERELRRERERGWLAYIEERSATACVEVGVSPELGLGLVRAVAASLGAAA